MADPSMSTSPSPPGGPTPSVTAYGSLPPRPPPKGLSKGAKIGIVVVVVVAVVVAALAAGVVPGVKLFGSGSSGPAVASSSSALGSANSTAAQYGAGALIAAIGVSLSYSYSFGALGSFTGTDCKAAHTLASNVSVPAETGSYSAGEAPLWVFLYNNTTAGTDSIIAVIGSTPYYLGTLSGSGCVSASVGAAISPGYVSSSTAASLVDSDAGSFISSHGSANAFYLLFENATAHAPEWVIIYTNCSYDFATNKTTGGSAAQLFLGEVNAATDTALLTTTDTLSCSGTISAVGIAPSIGATLERPAYAPSAVAGRGSRSTMG